MADPIIVPAPPQLSAKGTYDGKSSSGFSVRESDKFDGPNYAAGINPSRGNAGGSGGSESDGGSATGGGMFGFISGFELVGKIIDNLLDVVFWKRVGIGALGTVLIALSIGFIISSSNSQVVSALPKPKAPSHG